MNLLEREERHRKRRAPIDSVEDPDVVGKYLWEVDTQDADQDYDPSAAAAPVSVTAGLPPQDIEVIKLMQAKERRTEVYARVLEITDLPLAEQRRVVKRVKDRLQKRLERANAGK